ncbi:unnamed protein product, partial [Effrenium voratum]
DLGRREPEEAEESLELVGQELVPVGAKGKGNSGGRLREERPFKKAPAVEKAKETEKNNGQVGHVAGMELAGATSRMSPAARMPVENQEYVMRLVNELMAQNQCLMREIESLKNGKAVEESYGTPDSRDKSKVLSIEDKKSGDNSRKPMEVMGGNVDVSYGQN